MNIYSKVLIIFMVFSLAGCAPVLIGAGATGAYKVSSDERTMGDMWSDPGITAKVKTQMVKDSKIQGRKIDVDTVEGVVTLSGVVRTKAEADYAVKIASMVSGVKRVTDNLQVGSRSTGQVLDDSVLSSKIKAKYIGKAGIRSLNIDVDVYRGVVTLTGVVGSEAEKTKAIGIAKTTSGTVRVVDNLKIKAP
ncbi:MAG: BON domain-containing protein [Thermodesulfobacteriota bacterium]|nr:BON domain-containing protein [Thermodesulfobacteriota bacterium]